MNFGAKLNTLSLRCRSAQSWESEWPEAARNAREVAERLKEEQRYKEAKKQLATTKEPTVLRSLSEKWKKYWSDLSSEAEQQANSIEEEERRREDAIQRISKTEDPGELRELAFEFRTVFDDLANKAKSKAAKLEAQLERDRIAAVEEARRVELERKKAEKQLAEFSRAIDETKSDQALRDLCSEHEEYLGNKDIAQKISLRLDRFKQEKKQQEQWLRQSVICEGCGTRVYKSKSTYSASGDLLCPKCIMDNQ